MVQLDGFLKVLESNIINWLMKKPRLGIKVSFPSPTASNCLSWGPAGHLLKKEKELDDDSHDLTETGFVTLQWLN